MHCVIPYCFFIVPLLCCVFVNNLSDALETLALLFADNVNMVTPLTQNMNLHSSLIAARDWSQELDLRINPSKCNNLTVGREALLMGLAPPSMYPN